MKRDEMIQKIQVVDPNYQPKPIRPEYDDSIICPKNLTEIKQIIPNEAEYILSPILETQGIGFIYAATGIGKTLFTLNLAYAIARGGTFLKYSAPIPRKVLYIDAEMAYKHLYARIMTIAKQQGDSESPEYFNVLTPDLIKPARMPKIDDERGQNFYINLLQQNNYDVVVFDNLSMLSVFNENRQEEWFKIQDWLLYLRSLNKTILIVHHAGKDKTGYRGTSKMLDAADLAISLQSLGENDLEDRSTEVYRFKIKYEKHRNFGGKDALTYEVNLIKNEWSYKSIEKSEMELAYELSQVKVSQRDIAIELNCSQSKVNKLIKRAKEMELLNLL